MKLRNAFGLIVDVYFTIRLAFIPTLREITRAPSLLFHPAEISSIFMAHVWAFFGNVINENCREVKNALIPEDAQGVILDIGAGIFILAERIAKLTKESTGHGHTIPYLDMTKVSMYVALEPNKHMHEEIRKTATAAGLSESAGTLLILPYGAEQVSLIVSALGGSGAVDTMISIMALCSVPELETTIPALVDQVLKPGGRFLYYEHVLNKRRDVAWWQRFWTPIWGYAFGGCRLDMPTDRIISSLDVWEQKQITEMDGEDEESLFIHSIGNLTKVTDVHG